MRFKRLALHNPMMKHSIKKQAAGWTASKITEADQNKVNKDKFLLKSAEVFFLGGEIIPHPSKGFQVMFLSFLLCSLSLAAHDVLCGLLLIYGVQLHHLMPNSILHIAYFITLCEAFLGVDPHWGLWKHFFHLCRNVSWEEVHDLADVIVAVCLDSQYLKFKMADSVQN
jgi:hypothetical protein